MTNTSAIVFSYCERLSDGFWAEPVNAITNLVFILAAGLLGLQLTRTRVKPLRVVDILALVGLLLAIGIGSFLWHTLARPWTQWADVIPILLFISLYLLSFLHRIADMNPLRIMGWFGLYHMLNTGLQSYLPAETLNGSIFYLPTLVALVLIGIYTRHIRHPSAKHMLLAGILFTISIVFRTVDLALCHSWVMGTHFIWHIINAYVLYTLTTALIVAAQLDGKNQT